MLICALQWGSLHPAHALETAFLEFFANFLAGSDLVTPPYAFIIHVYPSPGVPPSLVFALARVLICIKSYCSPPMDQTMYFDVQVSPDRKSNIELPLHGHLWVSTLFPFHGTVSLLGFSNHCRFFFLPFFNLGKLPCYMGFFLYQLSELRYAQALLVPPLALCSFFKIGDSIVKLQAVRQMVSVTRTFTNHNLFVRMWSPYNHVGFLLYQLSGLRYVTPRSPRSMPMLMGVYHKYRPDARFYDHCSFILCTQTDDNKAYYSQTWASRQSLERMHRLSGDHLLIPERLGSKELVDIHMGETLPQCDSDQMPYIFVIEVHARAIIVADDMTI
ncbi:hypothetical protein DFJ58DRAFT_841526 [Suillus subalutaceus]|uniref:uncharacterized protein n=1 Tax=Suillus subalutaceus TaxID=48586 RepID=UPI001B87C358|nr:uncharacterized protein DFJ58DRAFT_841526 [Suillus subalutaceus]KAG1853926.1 hypothetical protein DFJ58DRAFT_841526 [Suillus subalutaceus]